MMNSNSTAPQKRSQVDLFLDDIETAVVDGVENGIQTCREKSVEVGFCNGLPSMYGKEETNEISEGAANTNMESLLNNCTSLSDTEGSLILNRNGDGDEKEENFKIPMPPGLTPGTKKDGNLVVDTVNNNTFVAKSAMSPASLSTSGSQSVMGMSLTESFSYDGMPPPMSLESYSTEKEDDDQFLQQHRSLNTEQPESPSKVLLPFTPRPGKSLFWRNVSITVAGRDITEPDRKVLNNVYGEVPEFKTTALIGSHGAGKSSLLNLLAGRVKTGERIHVIGDLRINNTPVDPYTAAHRKTIGFVPVDDFLLETVTPREAMKFSATLRLPRSTSESAIDKLVARMINELGLISCSDSMISEASKGEKKRISIGMELIERPTCLFLDEPTSGLDTFEAVQVCAVLKKVAGAGTSVLFSIQEPSSEIFSSCLDHLVLMHKGKVMYQGPVESVPDYFAARGFTCPSYYNFGDWMLQVAQNHPIENLQQAGFYSTVDPFAEKTSQDGSDVVHETKSTDKRSQRVPGVGKQICLLLKRECFSARRSLQSTMIRLGVTVFFSILIGILFINIGERRLEQSLNLHSQVGGMLVLLAFAMLRTVEPTASAFFEERSIYLRESGSHYSRQYSPMAYFVARLCIEAVKIGLHTLIMVLIIYFLAGFRGSFSVYFAGTYALAMASGAMASFLGAVSCGNEKMTQKLIALIFLPQLLFSGFFVASDLIPTFLSWAQWVCVLTPALRVLLVEEYDDCDDERVETEYCSEFLERIQADPDELLQYWVAIVAYFVIFRAAAMFLMKP